MNYDAHNTKPTQTLRSTWSMNIMWPRCHMQLNANLLQRSKWGRNEKGNKSGNGYDFHIISWALQNHLISEDEDKIIEQRVIHQQLCVMTRICCSRLCSNNVFRNGKRFQWYQYILKLLLRRQLFGLILSKNSQEKHLFSLKYLVTYSKLQCPNVFWELSLKMLCLSLLIKLG